MLTLMTLVSRHHIPSLAFSTGSSGAADLRHKRKIECLSPISSAVSTLEVPRQFGHRGKTASKQEKSARQRVNHLIFHRRAGGDGRRASDAERPGEVLVDCKQPGADDTLGELELLFTSAGGGAGGQADSF